jgi:hypothetical protein
VKIYAAATIVEAVKKKEIQEGESQFTTKTELPPPPLNANVFYFIFFNLTLFMDQTQGSSFVFLTL